MHLGSDEDFVTLYFPFGFNSQEKYGISSSATSKSGIAKGGEEKSKWLRGRRGMLHTAPVYLTCSSRPLASNMHALPQCTTAEAMSWDSSLTIYPLQLYTLLSAVSQHISITNFPLIVVLS